MSRLLLRKIFWTTHLLFATIKNKQTGWSCNASVVCSGSTCFDSLALHRPYWLKNFRIIPQSSQANGEILFKLGHVSSFRIHRSLSSGHSAVCSSSYWNVSKDNYKDTRQSWQLVSWHLILCFFIRCHGFVTLSDQHFFLSFCLLLFFTSPLLSFLLCLWIHLPFYLFP